MLNRPKNNLVLLAAVTLLTMFCHFSVQAENIDPDDDGSQYAWGENVGWLNFEPLGDGGAGVTVGNYKVSGYIWAENIGWINLSPASYGGVENNGSGNLSGYAWGENVGWINFSPTYGGVSIDAKGTIEGWAWGENIGWIHLQYSIDLTIVMTGVDQYTLSWNTTLNFVYQVWISTDLLSWSVADSNVVGEEGTTSWADAFTGTKRLYKVRQAIPDVPTYRVKTSWQP